MFKDLLARWVTELYEKFSSVGQNGYLDIGLGDFSPTLYGYVTSVMTDAAMPVAYTILALFFVLELYKASIRIDGAGGGSSFGAETVFKAMFRMAVCKTAVDSSPLILEGIYYAGKKVTEGIAAAASSPAVALDAAAGLAEIDGLNLGEQIGMLLELVIIKLGVWVILGLVQVVCIGRFIELYVYVAVSPIPLATLPSDDLNQTAKNFLKSFAAVCLQGALIYLVLSFFPVLVTAGVLGDTGIFGLLLYSLVLALGVFSAGRWAKSICSAM
jgi:hypothetical protein